MKKIKIYSEVVYIIAQLGLTFAVAVLAAADFGVSVVAAPAYIISARFDCFTFGEWSYIVQGALFVAFCVAVKRIRPIYLVSFLTCVIYGYALDMWRAIIPLLNPEVTIPGSMDTWVRVVMFIVGELLTAFTVMLFLRSYIYPQVCDLFVKGVAQKYKVNQVKFKRIYDAICLVVSVALSLVLLGSFVGVGWGTVVIALATGPLIGVFGKWYDKHVETVPLFPKLEKLFEI